MKKSNLLIVVSLLSLGAMAQERKPLVMVGMPTVLVEYRVSNVSPNGVWACGNVLDDPGHGFIWNLVSGELTQLSPTSEFSAALAVSNDGIVAGEFVDTEFTDNGVGVETGGYWQDGHWHHLPVGTDASVSMTCESGAAWCISPNGKYVGGIAYVGSKYLPAVWEIGGNMQIYVNNQGAVYGVNDDASIVAGWTYHKEKSNRTPTIWTSPTDSILPYYTVYNPWAVASSISPDNSKVLAYDCIIDMKTGEKHIIDPSAFEGYNGFEYHRVTNSGNVVGYVHHINGAQHAAYYKDGKMWDLKTYLLEQGADVEDYHMYQCSGISEDEKTFVINVLDSLEIPRIMAVHLDMNVETPAPVALKAGQLEGTSVCRLTWNEPLVNAAAVKGYHVWRNGEKITEQPLDTLFYYDTELVNGDYEYAVSAVYETAESEKSVAASVTMKERVVSAPRGLMSVHTGIKDVRLIWNNPVSNLPGLAYVDDTDEVYSMGGGDYNFEVGARFSKEDLAFYADKKITDISFYPMSVQSSWTVNFYTLDNMVTPFYSEEISVDDIVYGVENSVRLKNPVTLPTDNDLIMGVAVDVTGYGGYEVFGALFNKMKPGYNDLLRRVGEEAFMSTYQAGMTSEDGAYENTISFPLGIHFGSENLQEEKISYKVYANDVLLGETDKTQWRQNDVADGMYEYKVEAVYENGDVSNPVTSSFTMKANDAVYVGIKNLNYDINSEDILTLSWETPVEDDETVITYSNDTNTGGIAATEGVGYGYNIGTKYDAKKLRAYNDGTYYITDFRFYPLADAEYTFYLLVGDEEIASKELERGVDYTIGRWNSVKLDTPVKVEPATEYFLVLECYDVTPDASPVGMDSQISLTNISDLISTDDGETYSSLTETNGVTTGNWMIGMVVRAAEPKALPIEGYHVLIQNKTVTTEPIKETTYTYAEPLQDGTNYSLRVDVVYSIVGQKSGTRTFIKFSSAIDEMENAAFSVKLDTEAATLCVTEEGVTRLALYGLEGKQVAVSEGNTLDIPHLVGGVYVLEVTANGKTVCTKVLVNK